MGSIREVKKKNGETTYHVEVRLRGRKPARDSFRTKTEAKEWIQDTEAAIRDGRYKGRVGSKHHTVGDLIDRFISLCIPKHPRYYNQKAQLLKCLEMTVGYSVIVIVGFTELAGRHSLIQRQ